MITSVINIMLRNENGFGLNEHAAALPREMRERNPRFGDQVAFTHRRNGRSRFWVQRARELPRIKARAAARFDEQPVIQRLTKISLVVSLQDRRRLQLIEKLLGMSIGVAEIPGLEPQHHRLDRPKALNQRRFHRARGFSSGHRRPSR